MLISNGVIVAAVMLPFGLIQWAGVGFAFALTDFWAVLGLAVFSTALGGTIFLHGMRYIPVQHTSIVGLLEPASAPVFAFVFLAERPSLWTLVGGAPHPRRRRARGRCSAPRTRASPDRRRKLSARLGASP